MIAGSYYWTRIICTQNAMVLLIIFAILSDQHYDISYMKEKQHNKSVLICLE